MAMIRCSECGRAISDRAAHCVGCGAPSSRLAGVDWVPARSTRPPPSPRQLWLRGLLATGMLVGGALWAGALDHRPGGGRVLVTLATLLLITGLCGLVVTLLQGVALRSK
jgi:ribosomal protein L37E